MIETQNLKLIPCKLSYFEAILRNPKDLEAILEIVVPDQWTEFPEAIPHAYESLKANPSAWEWGAYLFVHQRDRMLIGWGGYKGPADESGVVEIGYEIIPTYRNRGLATEAAQGLIDRAFSYPRVNLVAAHTRAEANASTKLLEKMGMTLIETVNDPEEGQIWSWNLSREDYRNRLV